jgi:hypothetical protein
MAYCRHPASTEPRHATGLVRLAQKYLFNLEAGNLPLGFDDGRRWTEVWEINLVLAKSEGAGINRKSINPHSSILFR